MFKRIQRVDNVILDNISKLYSPVTNRTMNIISGLGNMGMIWFAFCLPFFVMRDWRMKGVNIVLGLCIAHLMGEIILKHIVCRARPCHRYDDEDLVIKNRPKYYSFPSGHTTASFSVVAVTVMTCPYYIFIPVTIMAMMIAFSRVYLRVHYLTDVLAGMCLGLICGSSSVSLLAYIIANYGVKL